MGAISRIFGFLILAIAVQLIWDGVADFKRSKELGAGAGSSRALETVLRVMSEIA